MTIALNWIDAPHVLPKTSNSELGLGFVDKKSRAGHDQNNVSDSMREVDTSSSYDHSSNDSGFESVVEWINMELQKASINEVGGVVLSGFPNTYWEGGMEELALDAAFEIQRQNMDLNLCPEEGISQVNQDSTSIWDMGYDYDNL